MNAIELNASPSTDFDAKLENARALIRQAAQDHPPLAGQAHARVTLACSLGAEDMVLADLVNRHAPQISLFVLQTGRLHSQTLQLLEQLKANSQAPVRVFEPVEHSVVQFVQREGADAMYKSIELRKACCHIRKMEPLDRALDGMSAWITGLRREQSGARAEVPFIDDADTSRLKFNPLVDWTWGDVWHYIATFHVAYNPLHDQFFPSIGCEPCTRAISLGEDFRAGRWWWENESAKECGLHVKADDASSPIALTQ